MADAADPVAGFALGGDWGTARALPLQSKWSLRARPVDAERLAVAWGAPLPEMLRAAAASERATLRIGPDEWFLIADHAAAAAGLAALPPEPPFALTDVSHRSVAIELAGSGVATLLNAGSPRDLSDAAFAPGTAARTVFGKAEIILWRPATTGAWRIEVWRSFADYVTRYLAQAAADL